MNAFLITFAVLATLPQQLHFSHKQCKTNWLSPPQLREMLAVELSERPPATGTPVHVALAQCADTRIQVSVTTGSGPQQCALNAPILFDADTPDKQRTVAIQISEMIQFCQNQTQGIKPAPSPTTTDESNKIPSEKENKIPSRVQSIPDYTTFALETRRGGWFCKCGLMELNENTPIKKTLTKFSPEDLFALADAARVDGNPQGAIVPLNTLLTQYPNHAKAPAAAFTIAKLYLDALFIPTRAAEYFEKAVALGLAEPLREAAFAKTAEAYHRARNPKYGAAVSTYARLYPQGKFKEMLFRLSTQKP